MVVFPNAKINLGLRVIERRKDGFHTIETIFLPIGLCDILEFVECHDHKSTLEVTGIAVPGKTEDNLILKAWQIMHQKHSIPFIEAHLHKIIPIGAGLGGGSSDAAFMLKGLNEFFSCGCSSGVLEAYAAELGSDCAFFIRNQPAIGTGRGEILEPIQIALSEYEILLINPGIHVGTREAYAGITPGKPESMLKELINMPVSRWQEIINNDFEKSVFATFPKIAELKKKILDQGAVYASMSGSGSSVYGIFRKGKLDNLSIDPEDIFQYRGKFSEE
jgi:4-diphosphocytidyl-2-C-methyl-D-erythritol kinase